MNARHGMKSNCQAGFFLLYSASFLLLIPVTPGNAAQMQDGQDYPAATSTPATGRSPWLIASSGAAGGSTSYIGIYAGDLTGTTTPPLAGLTNIINPEAHLQIAKAGTSSRTYYRSIGTSFISGSVYCSFLMNVSVNPTSSDEVMCELVPAVAGGSYPLNPTANDPLTLHTQKGADTSHFNLGIQSLSGAVSWASTNFADNTDYLVVLQYTFGAGQPCQLFINPIPGSPQSVASVTASKGATAEPPNLGTILFWESSTNTSISASYDVMRVDANWTNVTPSGGATTVTNNPPATNNAPPMSLLFLGDSLLGISTAYSNDIPAILMNLAQNFGDSVTNTTIANASWYLNMFATNTTAISDINSGNYNLVILQDQSQEPSLPIPRNNSFFPACRTLNSMITNSSEKTMFYETWGLLNGDTTANCGSYDIPAQYLDCDGGFGSFLSMNIALREGYAMIGNQLNAAISPVGLAWTTARQEQPSLNLYILDDSLGDRHPNSYGAYLAACVFYSTIFGRSPEGSTYYSSNDVASALYLQQVAAQTVLQDPFAPDSYGFGSGHYYWAYDWQNYSSPPSAPASTIVISGASAIPSPSVRVNSNVGVVSNLWLGTFDTNYNAAGQGRLYLYAGGSLVVSGAMVLGKEGKGFVQQYGGSLTVNGTLTLAEQANSTGEYTLTNGTLFATQILTGMGSGIFNFQGGQLGFTQFGSVALPINLTSVAGILSLTNTSGASMLFGNFTNGNAASLAIQLGNPANALTVSGTASIAGTLNISYATGFQPALGQQFTLLSAAGISGSFTSIIYPAVGPNGLGLVTTTTTTSIVATVSNFVPNLNMPKIATGDSFQFDVTGITGSQYAIQTSTNLLNWSPILTNVAPFTFTTNITSMDGQRFYRAVYLP